MVWRTMKEFSYERIVKDPSVFEDNRLPAHSDHIAYRTREELIAGETSLRMSLNGIWRFHYARNIHAAPERFWLISRWRGMMFLPM